MTFVVTSWCWWYNNKIRYVGTSYALVSKISPRWTRFFRQIFESFFEISIKIYSKILYSVQFTSILITDWSCTLLRVGSHWSHHGVAEFYTNVYNNGYNILYLTSRAIGQADSIQFFLKNILYQCLNFQIPVFVSEDSTDFFAPEHTNL